MKDKEWFEIHLEDIRSSEDFEEAMELSYLKGIESGEEEGYNAGIYSSVVEDKISEAILSERQRIIRLLIDSDAACREQSIALINGE